MVVIWLRWQMRWRQISKSSKYIKSWHHHGGDMTKMVNEVTPTIGRIISGEQIRNWGWLCKEHLTAIFNRVGRSEKQHIHLSTVTVNIHWDQSHQVERTDITVWCFSEAKLGVFVAYLQQQMLTLKDESALEVMGKTVFHCLALFLAFWGKLYDKVRRIATKLRTWRKLLPKRGSCMLQQDFNN